MRRKLIFAGQPQVYLKLRPAIAGALEGFTAQSIGRNLNIWIHGEQVSSVQVAEAIEGTELVIALPEAQVESLIALLAPTVTIAGREQSLPLFFHFTFHQKPFLTSYLMALATSRREGFICRTRLFNMPTRL
ncbi:hypothetical protein [Roseovarius sp. M141]|uniref:hypothetical protein n=1 Tax=Roseovarius sp. M141 TaxID=2583806 RepID=UPI0020CEE779|nr:hypothetical protein [Roseovarius sp. M141]MCQ0091086.1 hypothetical protein [Roseovarius sp. M141]